MREVRAIDNLDDMTNIIKNELENIAEGFVSVGYYLKKTRDDNLYKQKGYVSIFDYAEDVFGIKRSTATRFMQINDTYSVDGYSPQLEIKYRGYGSSKLTEMLGLPEEIRDTVPVETTVKDIRKAKAVVKETEHHYGDQMELCDVAPKMEKKVSWTNLLVKEFFKENKKAFEQMVDLIRKDALRDKERIEEDILAIVNPTKFKMFRLPTANVLMLEKTLQVMPYRDQGEKETFGYLEFAEAFKEVFYPEYPDVSQQINTIYEKEYGELLYEKKESSTPVPAEEKKDDSGSARKVETKKETVKKSDTAQTKAKPPKETATENPNKPVEEVKETENQIPGQTELTRDFPEYCPEPANTSKSKIEAEIEVPEEIMNRPYKTRKEFMESLGIEELSLYMANAMGEAIRTKLKSVSVQVLSTTGFWKPFLTQEVDEKGDIIEEVTNV